MSARKTYRSRATGYAARTQAFARSPTAGKSECRYSRAMLAGGIRASIANARSYRANPVAFYRSLTGGGDGYRAVAPFDFFGPNLLVNDPELVGTVLTSPSGEGFGKGDLRFFAVLRRMLGNGLFTVEGEHHRAQRRALRPMLQPRALAGGGAGAGGGGAAGGAAGDAMSRAAERLRSEWSDGPDRVVDVQDAAGRVALDLLADAVAGPSHAHRVRELGLLVERAERPLLDVLEAPVVFPAWLRTPANRRLGAATDALRRSAAELLLADGIEPGALLEGLRRDADGDQLLDELVTLVVAGHQSTAASIAFSLHLLAAHPEHAARLAAEARSVLAGRPATMADLPSLPYTALVVAESMRLFPPVWIITRRVLRERQWAGRRVPAGAVVHVCPHTLHRNPAHWPEPDRFAPERFADLDARRGRHRFAYAPFGGGPHKCIGNHFALAATAIVLATLAPSVRFAPPAAEPTVGARSFTVAEGGLPLRLLRP